MAIRPAQAGGECMRQNLSGFFTETVTILEATLTPDAYGERLRSWSVLADHIAIPALVAGGDVSIRMKKQEFRTAQNVHEMVYRRVMLAGYYPSIKHEHRARFEDMDWAIISTVTDVTQTWTELLCESLEPGNL